MQEYFSGFARYNAWANRLIFDAAAELTDAQYRENRAAFFKSVHGTLNHMLVTDRVWMRRITGTGDAPDRLDAILFEQLAELRTAREAEDHRIIAHVDSLTDADLAGTISYRRVSTPEPFVAALTPTFAHLFNHQTHHRGQVHALLTALRGRAPELDLLYFQRLQAPARA